jgi:hypothetical protein
MKKIYLLTGILLLLMVGSSGNVIAQSITISGAGSDVNGLYHQQYGGGDRVDYTRDDGQRFILYLGDRWKICGGGGWAYYSNNANTAIPPGPGWEVYTGPANLDGQLPLPIVTGDVDPLPVELTSFTAIAKGKNVELKWNTATETNNYGFDVEKKRMKDDLGNMNWDNIGFVEGHGTTNSPKSYTFIDGSASGTVVYRLKQVDRDGSFEYSNQVEVTVASPAEFALMQNHPNPFNPATSIRYQVAAPGHVSLKVYDMLGKEVAVLVNGVQDAGVHIVKFSAGGGSAFGGDASQLPSGIYFYTLRTNNFNATKKMLLVK